MPRPLASFWQAISEVPGWPDAPLGVRLRRLWPLVLPLAVCIVLASWIYLVREPHRAEVRADHAHLVALEDEVALLQQACSELLATELAERSTAAQERLLAGPADVQARLDTFAGRARATGWKVTAQVYGSVDMDTVAEETTPAAVMHVPARVRLEPRPGHADAFNSMFGLIRSLSGDAIGLDITALIIRADQPGVPVAEINLRASCRPRS